MIYKIRASLDRGKEEDQKKEAVFRDIKIKSTHSLMDLHKALKKSFGFLQEELSSFYYVDESWKITKEVSLENMTEEEDFLTMLDINTKEAFPNKDSKLLYIYDFLELWTFHLEVLEIEDKEGVFSSPLTINVQGKMPLKSPIRSFEVQKINSSQLEDFIEEEEKELDDEFSDQVDLDEAYLQEFEDLRLDQEEEK